MPVEDIEKKKIENELEETWPLDHIPKPQPREVRDTTRDPDNSTEDEKPDRIIRINR